MTYEKSKPFFGYFVSGLQWFCATLPVTLLAVVYTYYLRARNLLGYWPEPYRPDPKTDALVSVMGYHYQLAGILFYLVLPSAFLFLLLIPLCKFLRPAFIMKKRWAVLLISWLLFMFIMRNDPGHIIEWYFD